MLMNIVESELKDSKEQQSNINSKNIPFKKVSSELEDDGIAADSPFCTQTKTVAAV